MARFAGVAAGTTLASQNALVASTLPRLSSEIADNIFNDLPFFFWIRNKGKVKKWDSGETYEVNLMYGKNEYARAYDDYELLDVGPPSGFGNAIFIRAKYRVPLMYAATTLSANSGRAQIYNLIEKLKMQATKSLEDVINTDLFAAEVAAGSVDTKKITSMFQMIEAAVAGAGAQGSIIGGINKATAAYYSWWNNQYTDATGSGTASALLSHLRTNVIACTDGRDGPDLGLCDSFSYAEIEDAAFDKRRFVNADAANLGFTNVVYNGVTYMYDKSIDDQVGGDSVGDGYTFHINSDHLYLAVCTDRNFQVVPPEYDVNQDCYLGAVMTHMQLITDGMKYQGIVKGTAEIA